MLPYFRRYTILACVIGIVPGLVLSTVYPLFTGTIMAASLGGLLLLLAVFAMSMTIGVNLMERRAERETDALLALYNVECDPQALIEQGREVAARITFPCRDAGAWFMSYYAQAQLDAGRKEDARSIEQGLRQSMLAAKKPQAEAGILVNLIPLADKLDGTQAALELIERGLQLTDGDPSPVAAERRAFLESQRKIMEVRMTGDAAAAAKMDASIADSGAYPMRIRVEAAWAQARACFKLGDAAGERSALDLVVAHGNKLALVAQARQRLAALA